MAEQPTQDSTASPQEPESENIGIVSYTEQPSYETTPIRERTRRWLAYALTALVMFMVAIFLVRILFISPPLDADSLDAFKTILAVIAGIYGSVIGFFFGTQGD